MAIFAFGLNSASGEAALSVGCGHVGIVAGGLGAMTRAVSIYRFDMPIIIECGVPIPPRYNKSTSELFNTLGRMKVGDSIKVPNETVACYAWQWAKKNGFKIVRRKLDGDGFRIWRVK